MLRVRPVDFLRSKIQLLFNTLTLNFYMYSFGIVHLSLTFKKLCFSLGWISPRGTKNWGLAILDPYRDFVPMSDTPNFTSLHHIAFFESLSVQIGRRCGLCWCSGEKGKVRYSKVSKSRIFHVCGEPPTSKSI